MIFDDKLSEDDPETDADEKFSATFNAETLRNIADQESITWDGASTSGKILGIDPNEIDTSGSYDYTSDGDDWIPEPTKTPDPDEMLRILRKKASRDSNQTETVQEHRSRVKSLVDFMLGFLAEIDRSAVHLSQFKDDFQVVQEAYAKTQNGKPLTKTEMISLNNIHKRYKSDD